MIFLNANVVSDTMVNKQMKILKKSVNLLLKEKNQILAKYIHLILDLKDLAQHVHVIVDMLHESYKEV
jgi:hypothetical protein